MGTALADVLVELSSPKQRAEFKKDPERFLADRPLSEKEKDALTNGDLALIWRHAKSVDTEDPSQQFNRLDHRTSDLLIEIDPVVELHVEHNDLTAAYPEGAKQTIVDDEGRLFRLEDVK